MDLQLEEEAELQLDVDSRFNRYRYMCVFFLLRNMIKHHKRLNECGES